MASTAERRRTGGAAGPARGRDAALMGVGGLGPRALSHQHGGELQVEGPSAEPVPPRQVGLLCPQTCFFDLLCVIDGLH